MEVNQKENEEKIDIWTEEKGQEIKNEEKEKVMINIDMMIGIGGIEIGIEIEHMIGINIKIENEIGIETEIGIEIEIGGVIILGNRK